MVKGLLKKVGGWKKLINDGPEQTIDWAIKSRNLAMRDLFGCSWEQMSSADDQERMILDLLEKMLVKEADRRERVEER